MAAAASTAVRPPQNPTTSSPPVAASTCMKHMCLSTCLLADVSCPTRHVRRMVQLDDQKLRNGQCYFGGILIVLSMYFGDA